MTKKNNLQKREKQLQHSQSSNEKKVSETGRIWAILEKSALAILPAIVALIGAYYFFRRDAHPDFYCSPQEGEAPLTVKFFMELTRDNKVFEGKFLGHGIKFDDIVHGTVFFRESRSHSNKTRIGAV